MPRKQEPGRGLEQKRLVNCWMAADFISNLLHPSAYHVKGHLCLLGYCHKLVQLTLAVQVEQLQLQDIHSAEENTDRGA